MRLLILVYQIQQEDFIKFNTTGSQSVRIGWNRYEHRPALEVGKQFDVTETNKTN